MEMIRLPGFDGGRFLYQTGKYLVVPVKKTKLRDDAGKPEYESMQAPVSEDSYRGQRLDVEA